jgi:glycolate oxidase iron-sulfur subunit
VVELCRWLLDRRADWQPRLQLRAERVGLYLPCSHRNSVGDVAAVHGLLAAMPGLQTVELSGGYGCCGAAGPHLLAHPQRADALAAPIVQQIKDLQLTRVLTTNVGCAMHLQERLMMSGVNVELSHPVACLSDRLPLSVP